ncbi:hypothetical protein [Salsipaludibacter albus]|uniref:hypothetical protein n=1 Tax=Salsipaludibacter albus TaxID=2849650 RepID=UPI001EE477A0|nr:hypothetical protein [Salsipaludibacter albus]MBY5162377.1 hypothetical protein [Salsipaludibacter albus]
MVPTLQVTACPACGLPAEVWDRAVLASTDGPVEHARVRCLDRHVFLLPVAMLADSSTPEPSGGADAGGRSRSRPNATTRRTS